MATVATGSALEKGMAYIADSKRSATAEMRTMKGIGTLCSYKITLYVKCAYTIDVRSSTMSDTITSNTVNDSHIAITIGEFEIGQMLQDISGVEPHVSRSETTSTNSTVWRSGESTTMCFW